MLDFIYYPVSFILWCWHWVFGHLLGPSNGIGWALSVVFLVFSVRLVLLKPAVAQVRSMRKMQEFQPQIKKLQEKYKGDRQKLAAEMQKLQSEHGVNPLGGCLPLVLQLPVFIGLNQVLRNFHPGGASNYFFKAADVQSYVNADLFGARLSNFITEPVAQLATFGVTRTSVIIVAVPLMIAASIATHFTARHSVERQAAMGTAQTQQTAIMNKLTMWIFPLGVLTFGVAFPIGLLLYWLSNNAWTLGQQHFVYQQIDKEESAKKVVAQEQRQSLAPKPGQRPTQDRKKRPASTTTTSSTSAANGTDPKSGASTSGTSKSSAAKNSADPANGDGEIPGMISSGSRKKPRKKS